MNDRFASTHLNQLLTHDGFPAVSIYMPTHRVTTHIDEDRLRFRNLLGKAHDELESAGLRSPQIRSLLAPAAALEGDGAFWRNQSTGLALFLSDSQSTILRLPADFAETVIVSRRYHIKPLLQLLTHEGLFYILALSQNQIRLLQGSRHVVDELALNEADIPASLKEALNADDPQKQLQYHSGSAPAVPGGGSGPIFHGHGADVKPKDDILRYFRQIDSGLHELLKSERVPLVLAGVDYLLPIYHEASSYSSLVYEGIEGNPENLSNEELHDKAWALVEPIFAHAQEEATAAYRELAGTGRTSADIGEIVSAAYQGRVSSALVSVDAHEWGTYNTDADQVELHDEQAAESQDLLDLAAAYTLQNGGEVFAVPQAEIPDGAPIVAVYRY